MKYTWIAISIASDFWTSWWSIINIVFILSSKEIPTNGPWNWVSWVSIERRSCEIAVIEFEIDKISIGFACK